MSSPPATPAPLAYTVHPGGAVPAGWKQKALAAWLPANGINPNLVAAGEAIRVMPIPVGSSDGGPMMVQVIVFSQLHVDQAGEPEYNLISGTTIRFQRTVPLQSHFPQDPATTPAADPVPEPAAQETHEDVPQAPEDIQEDPPEDEGSQAA